MNLRYDYFAAYDAGIDLHAQEEMRRLGITYSRAEAQPIGEQWWFYDCENVPEPLPSYLSMLDDPEQPYSLATHADPRVVWAELVELRTRVGRMREAMTGCYAKNGQGQEYCRVCGWHARRHDSWCYIAPFEQALAPSPAEEKSR